MKIIEAEEQKKIQMDLLDSIAEFCDRHGLRYFLGYGTLLGAIRHKGFIPWDDDIDLIMPRPDYAIFCKEYSGCNGNYQVLYSGNDKDYAVPFAKVHDVRTRYQESYSEINNYGVFVDIFPLDGLGETKQIKKCANVYKIIHYKTIRPNKSNPLLKNIAVSLLNILLFPIPLRRLLKIIERESVRFKFEDSEKCYVFTESTPEYLTDWFSESIKTKFEDKEYSIPKEYGKILECQYGDYMQLPPEEERINKHHAKAWWK